MSGLDFSKVNLDDFRRETPDPTLTVESTLQQNPLVQASKVNYAAKSGLPVDLVDQGQSRIDEILQGLDKQATSTAQLLQDMNTSSLVHDDVTSLSKLEMVFRQPVKVKPVGNFISANELSDIVHGKTDRLSGVTDPFFDRVLSGGIADLNKNINTMYNVVKSALGGKVDPIRKARYERISQSFQPTPKQAKFMQELYNAPSLAVGAALILSNPLESFESLARSAVATSPAIIAGVAAAPLGVVGTMGVYFSSTFAIEFASSLDDALATSGVDMTDPRAVGEILSNDELMSSAYTKAGIRASAISVAAAITGGLAGRFLARAVPTHTAITKSIAQEASLQFGGAAAGEAVAEVATGEYHPGLVIFEGFGGVASAPFEVGANYHNYMARAVHLEEQRSLINLIRKDEQLMIDSVIEVSKTVKLKQISKRTFDKFIGEISNGEEFIFSNSAVTSLIGNHESSVIKSDIFLSVLEEKLASSHGEDIRLSPSELTTLYVGSKYEGELRDHIKMTDSSETPAEVGVNTTEHFKRMKGIVKEAEKRAEMDAESKAVYEKIFKDLKIAGTNTIAHARLVGKLISSYVAVQASETGKGVLETYKLLGLTVEREISLNGDRGYYSPSKTLIRLTQASDPSTMIHEFSHFILDMEMRKGEKSGHIGALNSTLNVREIATIAGVEISEVRILPDGTIPNNEVFKAIHEDVAKNFEAYVMAGVPPSQKLKPTFREFSNWMLEVYRDGELNNEVTPSIKKLFGALLAGEDAVKSAIDTKSAPLFRGKKPKMMTDKDWSDYNLSAQNINDTASETVRSKIMKALLKNETDARKEEWKKIFDLKLVEVKTRKVYKAINALRGVERAKSEKERKENLAKLGKRPSVSKGDTLLGVIRNHGGIPTSEAVELTGEVNVVKSGYGSFFRKDALGIDELAVMLESEGFGVDASSSDGGVEHLRDLIREALSGGEVLNPTGINDSVARDEYDSQVRSFSSLINMRINYSDVTGIYDTVVKASGNRKASKRLNPKLNRMTTKGNYGIPLEESAMVHGYKSGDEMIQAILMATTEKEAAKVATDIEMKQLHGSVTSSENLAKLAEEALDNDHKGESILKEIKALSGRNTSKVGELKSAAEDVVNTMTYNELKPAQYRSSELNIAKAAAVAYSKGDNVEATRLKQDQARNHYLAIAAEKAKADIVKKVESTKRFGKKETIKKITKAKNNFFGQVLSILDRFEFRKSATLKSVDKINEDVNSWAERVRLEEQVPLNIDAATLSGQKTHWKNLAYGELKGVIATLDHLEHVANYTNEFNSGKEKVDFDTFVEKLTKHIGDNAKSKFNTSDISSKHDMFAGIKRQGRLFNAQMTKVGFLTSWLDGGERVGMSHDALFQGATDAFHAKAELYKEFAKEITDHVDNLSVTESLRWNSKKKVQSAKTDVNAGNFRIFQIILVALNAGNAGNLRKMMRGEQWAKTDEDVTIDSQVLQDLFAHLTDSDWDFIELVWKKMGGLFPHLAEAHYKTTGEKLKPVKAEPFVLANGRTVSGGYFPLRYDPNRSQRVKMAEEKLNATTDSMLNGRGSIAAEVLASATNERKGFFAPINLELNVIVDSFGEATHYISHHAFIRKTNKLLTDQRVATAITEALNPEEFSQLRPWLSDVANDGRRVEQAQVISQLMNHMRLGTVYVSLGLSGSTGLSQFLGWGASATEVGSVNLAAALKGVLAHPQDSLQFALNNSKVVPHRLVTFDRDFNEGIMAVAHLPYVRALRKMSMAHIAYIQFYAVDLPTWHAAYAKGMKDFNGDEGRAFKYADWAVEQIQGSGSTHNMSSIMRNKNGVFRALTLFMTFFSSQWNITRDKIRINPTTYSLAASAFLLFIIPSFVDSLAREGLPDGENETDEWLKRVMVKSALSPSIPLPLLRSVAEAGATDHGFSFSPIVSAMDNGIRGFKGAVSGEFTQANVKNITKISAIMLHVPGVNQDWKTIEAWQKLKDGEDTAILEFVYGVRR